MSSDLVISNSARDDPEAMEQAKINEYLKWFGVYGDLYMTD